MADSTKIELSEIHPDIVSGKTGYLKMAQQKASKVPDLQRDALKAKHAVEIAKLEEKLASKKTTAKKVTRG
jgi:hypothetical protein